MPAYLSPAARVLGERIRAQRLTFAISQDDVANLAGMNVSNYGKIERGLSNPTFHTIIKIASVLGIDPGELVSGLSEDSLPPEVETFTARDFVLERTKRRTAPLR
ncbi:transcriptional regulator with XRE-family HTH domain [Microbacteriaceae bacterium SG_E_30_P1]|uniref:Transcriptional regulator with XRE-family HTH domain n=1 Tax=Antiquaquibacter oligotrophicus TaxID=2880260 RepID=A0ABT6KMX5_9MICO|nr:helix-turn-helix transcriptional regulator [Antiquaquibacter oligotrophicus]MDH6180447.1 transcriptional regulator with XRE-family HTH domain [Antiquaquibacter oligotrophicus]UDF13815.1 helix-turn-helix domain-containing protein [Antiquaquibacter oligotrophicus]